MIVQGIVSVLAGVIALAWPGVTALALLFVVAFWAIMLGIGEIGGAFASRNRGSTPSRSSPASSPSHSTTRSFTPS